MSDYDRVAAAIRFFEQHQLSQPSLAEVAAAAGLSESHFHRLFHRWAGVTPKDFLQCLTAAEARRRLQQSASVLEAALDAGLSGPGRLHDLFIGLEAATPGEVKSGGRGMRIAWGRVMSPFGVCSLGWTDRGVCHLVFADDPAPEGVPAELRAQWPSATLEEDPAGARALACRVYESGGGVRDRLTAFVRGTAFQVRVWRALLQIPEGTLTTYRRVAEAVEVPRAFRAVGAACGANPVAYLIPCHRVIRETGVVEGYRWGTTRKQALLAREAATSPSRPTP